MKTRIFLLIALISVSAHDGVPQDKTQDLKFRANRIEQAAPGVVKATGNVVASFTKLTIRADALEARADSNAKTSVIIAEGNVVIERGVERFQLRRLQLDLLTGRGTFELQQP